MHNKYSLWVFLLFAFLVIPFATASSVSAAKLTLSWTDNASSEDGFRIERRIGTGGTYQQLTQVAANSVHYTDENLASSTTYCYRVSAFNSSGSSGYSNENCATTAADVFVLSISRSGTGSGVVTSSPAGISCAADCSESYTTGRTVSLTAVAAAGSVFAGWSGPADCSDGIVTVNAAMQCTATFNLPVAHILTTTIVNEVAASGTASGRIVSNPTGIDCGSDCTENYSAGQTVGLTPIPGANSKFAGWSGDCAAGSVTMNNAKTCTAKFQLNSVTVSVAKRGKGHVKAAATSLACGNSCVYTAAVGSAVNLIATPEAGSVFAGWSGGGCTASANCTLTLTSDMTITASFVSTLGDKIGVYRPSDGYWFLDRDGSGTWDGCQVDRCIQLSGGGSNTVPVVGDWSKSGTTKIGFFVSDSSDWYLDANGNGMWDGCTVDICSSFGDPTDIPVVGRWANGAEDRVAIFRPSERKWHLDINGNETLDRCRVDKCAALSVYQAGDLPITGDWTGRGTSQLGLFRPSTGQWFLDQNANTAWNGCKKDVCIASFGQAGDVPVAGDWNGTGISKIGVFRPSTGEWFLDLNGNGVWDGPTVDSYLSGYGQTGDIPVIGKW